MFKTGDGIDGVTKNIALGVLTDIAGGLLKLNNLRLALETIQQKHAGILGQTQSGGDLRKQPLLASPLRFDVLVELHRFWQSRSRDALFFVLLGCGPVDQ